MPDPAFTIERALVDGAVELRVRGRLALQDGDELLSALRRENPGRGARVIAELSGVERMDGATTALLLTVASEHRRRGGVFEVAGANEQVRRMLELYSAAQTDVERLEQPQRFGFFEEVGRATAGQLAVAKSIFGFSGHLVVSTLRAIRQPSTVHWRDLGLLMERAGADAVPIVTLINFLVGLIMGYQAAIQLERFGANVFIADLVGLSITRELGPLMTAIIVAGRSGAAYAAELGTMQVREEIDALSTLSLDPVRFLVFPRIVALMVVMPLLTLLADLVGCVGGLLVAITQLDLTLATYVSELQKAVDLWDVFGGVIKSGVFAATITLIACQRGLATRGGADAVGASTTAAVVVILFALVALDAGFAVLFNALKI